MVNCERDSASASAIRLEELTASTSEHDLALAREMLLDYGRFVAAQPGAARFCFGALQQEADRLPASFIEQGGGCLLAWNGAEPAGFVAWRALKSTAGIAPESWEMKRLWVRAVHRGHGLGRLLTQAVLDRAATAQRKAVYLDTAPEFMGSAYRLYLDMGFAPCARYNDNPVDGLAFLVKFPGEIPLTG